MGRIRRSLSADHCDHGNSVVSCHEGSDVLIGTLYIWGISQLKIVICALGGQHKLHYIIISCH